MHTMFSLLLVWAYSVLQGAEVSPHTVGLDAAILNHIDAAVLQAIREQKTPGAVVLILRHGKVAYRRAFGQRSLQPPTPMTVDTVFDLASLTKPVATAASILKLVEQEKLRLTDPVAKYRPSFGKHGKERITLEQLLLHTSGLIADNPLTDYQGSREQMLARIDNLKLTAPPGTKFIYSDVGYILLGELVRQVSGLPLDQFAEQHFFQPLGMRATAFHLSEDLCRRTAPTEPDAQGKFHPGQVHDPRARCLGGVAGHAGLFSTVDDLARFAQMLHNGGEWDGQRILAPATVRLMTQPRPVPGGLRTYGWDVETRYSSPRGQGFAVGTSFGHSGFTGTSLWLDPDSGMTVIFLSNRVHPDGKGNVNTLRATVATLAAAARKK
jgi:CubicO group peptidase (beta-lactamase class C family)